MQIPDALTRLIDDGIIERVVRPLMSGKEAHVFLVRSQGELRVAKVYKEAHNRTFKHRAEYTEGRKTRNSRDQRAVDKRSKHGRAQDEAAWRSTEVDMIHRLHAGGVRVPIPYAFIDGVLIMECVVDTDGLPAPRLGEVALDPDTARAFYDGVLCEVVRMLAAGVVHGDLSDFNVLVAGSVPVIIDFPQSVDTAGNTNARRLLIRDVDNLHRFLSRHVPRAPRLPYAEEMWELYENNALTADTRLTGRYRPSARRASNESVLDLIRDADYDERKRREALGLRGGPRPVVIDLVGSASRRPPFQKAQPAKMEGTLARSQPTQRSQPAQRTQPAQQSPNAQRSQSTQRSQPAQRPPQPPRAQPAPPPPIPNASSSNPRRAVRRRGHTVPQG